MTKQHALTILKGSIFSTCSFCFMYIITYILLSVITTEINLEENLQIYKAIKGMSLISAILFMLFATFMYWHTEWQNKKLQKKIKENK